MGLSVELSEQRLTLAARHIGYGTKPVYEGTGATSSFYLMAVQPGSTGLPLPNRPESTHATPLHTLCGQAPVMRSHVRR